MWDGWDGRGCYLEDLGIDIVAVDDYYYDVDCSYYDYVLLLLCISIISMYWYVLMLYYYMMIVSLNYYITRFRCQFYLPLLVFVMIPAVLLPPRFLCKIDMKKRPAKVASKLETFGVKSGVDQIVFGSTCTRIGWRSYEVLMALNNTTYTNLLG